MMIVDLRVTWVDHKPAISDEAVGLTPNTEVKSNYIQHLLSNNDKKEEPTKTHW